MDPQVPANAPVRGAWQCPECGRHVPPRVDVCRCGLDRSRLEAAGYKFQAPPQVPTTVVAPAARTQRSLGLFGRLIGYTPDTHLGREWRRALAATLVAAVAGVGHPGTATFSPDFVSSRNRPHDLIQLRVLYEKLRVSHSGTRCGRVRPFRRHQLRTACREPTGLLMDACPQAASLEAGPTRGWRSTMVECA